MSNLVSRMSFQKSTWVSILAILLLSAAILIPVSPIYRTVPAVDFSVFLYVGRVILHGGVPYRDAWDHKQPLIYLICAFGQWLTPGSLWGVWWLFYLSISSMAVTLYVYLKKMQGKLLSFLSVSAGLLALSSILWGGAIEEFALPAHALVILCLGMVISAQNDRQLFFYSAGLGVFISVGFFFKHNLVSAGLASLIYLFGYLILTRRQRVWKGIAGVLSGFVLVGLPIILYLGISGALTDYWNTAFVFNFRYAGLGLLERYHASLDALEYMSTLPGLWIALTTWIACIGIVFLQACPILARILSFPLYLRTGAAFGLVLIVLSLGVEPFWGQPGLGLVQLLALGVGILLAGICSLLLIPRIQRSVVVWLQQIPQIPTALNENGPGLNLPLFCLLYFPLTLALVVVSGRNYVYYFISFIPFLIIGFGAVGYTILQLVQGVRQIVVWVIVIAVWLSMAYLPLLQVSSAYAGARNAPQPDIVTYISSHTHPDDTILAWGKPSPYLYILSDRFAPTRYFYQAPVDETGYNADFLISTAILDDLRAHSPRLFLYQEEDSVPKPNVTCPLIGSSDANTPGAIFAFICERYAYTGKVSDYLVFTLKDEP